MPNHLLIYPNSHILPSYTNNVKFIYIFIFKGGRCCEAAEDLAAFVIVVDCESRLKIIKAAEINGSLSFLLRAKDDGDDDEVLGRAGVLGGAGGGRQVVQVQEERQIRMWVGQKGNVGNWGGFGSVLEDVVSVMCNRQIRSWTWTFARLLILNYQLSCTERCLDRF